MGWGEPHRPRQGDMGAGVLSTSQAITQRSIERNAGRDLAEAVEVWRRNPSTSNAEKMCAAHDAYKRAHGTCGDFGQGARPLHANGRTGSS